MVDGDRRFDVPGIGEIVRRLDRTDAKIEELRDKIEEVEAANQRRHEDNLAINRAFYKEFHDANRNTYETLQAKIQELDKRQTIAETTQKITVAVLATGASIITSAIVAMIFQFLTHR